MFRSCNLGDGRHTQVYFETSRLRSRAHADGRTTAASLPERGLQKLPHRWRAVSSFLSLFNVGKQTRVMANQVRVMAVAVRWAADSASAPWGTPPPRPQLEGITVAARGTFSLSIQAVFHVY